MDLITGVPGLIAILICIRRGPERAFLNVYLPVLLLIPDGYRWSITGHLTFSETAIIPIAVFCIVHSWSDWKWTFTDYLLLALSALMAISEGLNKNFYEGRNVALEMTCTAIMPYMLGKLLLRREAISIAAARRIALLMTVVAISGLYEFKMGVNPYNRTLLWFFPWNVVWVTTFRYGFARVAGPFSHAILAGIMLVAAYRIVKWLDWTNAWPGNVPLLPISKVRFCELSIIAGSIMTFCRGPWIGAAAATLVIAMCRSRNRRLMVPAILFVTLLAGVPAYLKFKAYVSVGFDQAATLSQQTAVYRRELIDQYSVVAEQSPIIGYGRNNFPALAGLPSVDNYYLLLALEHGFIAAGLLILILLTMLVRLLIFGVRRPRDDPAAALAFTLMGVSIAIAVAIATVYLGLQTAPFLFLVIGWGEGLLSSGGLVGAVPAAEARKVIRATNFRFQRVMA